MILGKMIVYATPLMIVAALSPMGTNGDVWGKPRMFKLGSRANTGKESNSNLPKPRPSHSQPRTDLPQPRLNLPINQRMESIGPVGAAVGGRGWVEMEARIDMGAVIGLLEDIPEILFVLRNMTQSHDAFDLEVLLTQISRLLTGLREGVHVDIEQINAEIREMILGLRNGPLNVMETNIQQILEILGHSSRIPGQCDLTEIETEIRTSSRSIEDLIAQLIQLIRSEGGSSGDQGIGFTSDNHELLLKIFAIVSNLRDLSTGGRGGNLECDLCAMLRNVIQIERDNSNEISQLVEIVQQLPSEIAILIKSEGGIGVGIKRDIEVMIDIEESIQASIVQMARMMQTLTVMSERYFNAHQKIIIDTQYSVEEAAKLIEKSSTATAQAVKQMVHEVKKDKLASRSACKH